MRFGTSVAALAAVTLMLSACHRGNDSTGTAPPGAGKGPGDGTDKDAPVPVSVTKVRQEDVPVFLDGLGTVQALNTATIKAQVSGKLIEVPFKEGDEVRRGDVLARIDPRTYQAALDQAIAKRAQDQATLASAKLDLKRYDGLVADGYVTSQQVDQQKATVAETDALLQSDVAAIDSARAQLSYCVITAPFDGVVGLRLIDVGNLVQAGDTTGIVTVTQIKPISVTFTLPEQSLPRIRGADAHPLPVLAVDRDNHAKLAEGELLAIDNQVDQTTGTIKLKATFANSDKALWPGQFVNARLRVGTERNALVVPTVAVQLGPNGSFVYLVNGQHGVDVHPVVVSQTEAGVAAIAQGVAVNDTVVVDGQSRLEAGSKVEATEAPGSPGGSNPAAPKTDVPAATDRSTPGQAAPSSPGSR